ncbi:hypothetical protein [Thalassobellus suaedae]|uniref:TonB-dependent receptor n=1 Tax=Thalassobellus suaedae TaxID=3074124 RepID=A0ABY9XWZ8_9FLAO|nr:hypothetical protein RHP51_06515 [Flavobacteriaceae bacterium HL-DH14]
MKYIWFSLFSCLFFQGFSQNYFDVLNVTYTNTPNNNFEITDAQTTVQELALELNFPVVINEKTILLTGLFANKTKVKLDANSSNENLDVIGLNVGVNRTFNDTWSATFMLYSKLASDAIKVS